MLMLNNRSENLQVDITTVVLYILVFSQFFKVSSRFIAVRCRSDRGGIQAYCTEVEKKLFEETVCY